MMDLNMDVQCKQILDGITRLEEILQDPLAKEALAMSDNFNTNRNKEILVRLRKSLTQYVERGKDLLYVGFMGHFSTGKSSSINSLLSLEEETDSSRRVGLNPVDKIITLITHKNNEELVLNSTVGDTVSISVEFIEHDFLKDIVLADTPGVGDPVLATKITKDFLPICDLIIYFFSATNPLDSADVPLLTAKQEKLPFIPIKFVVTRADEFRKDNNFPLDETNFERFKSENFIETLSYRLNNLIQYEQGFIGVEHIILIDNKSQFNIDKFRKLISELADVSKAQTKISLHSHKVQYFRSSAEELKYFFNNFITKKLTTISDIVKKADANVARFQNAIQVANNGLTKSWSEQVKSIENKKLELRDDISKSFSPRTVSGQISIPTSISEIVRKSFNEDEIRENIIQQAKVRNHEIKESLRTAIQSRLKSDTFVQEQRINENLFKDSDYLERIEFKVSKNLVEKTLEKVYLRPSLQLKDDTQKTLNRASQNVNELYKNIKSAARNLQNKLNSRQPIPFYETRLNLATESLSNDLDTFFESIDVYRSSMFTLGVRSAISALGLGEKLDLLEKNSFTEEAKLILKQEAQERMFPDNDRAFFGLSGLIPSLSERCKAVTDKLESLNSIAPANPKILEDSALESKISKELKFIADRIDFKISDFQRDINSELRELFNTTQRNLEKEISEVKSRKRERLLFSFLVSTILGLGGYLLFLRFQDMNYANNASTIFFSGILVNIVTNTIGFLYTNVKNNLPELFLKKERALIEDFRTRSRFVIQQRIENFDPFPDKDDDFHQNLWVEALFTDPLEKWQKDNTDFYEQLKDVSKKYIDIREKYWEIICDSSDIARGYFSNSENNLKKLKDISESLKETAIEPSFALLAETQKELEAVSALIQEVSFT